MKAMVCAALGGPEERALQVVTDSAVSGKAVLVS